MRHWSRVTRESLTVSTVASSFPIHPLPYFCSARWLLLLTSEFWSVYKIIISFSNSHLSNCCRAEILSRGISSVGILNWASSPHKLVLQTCVMSWNRPIKLNIIQFVLCWTSCSRSCGATNRQNCYHRGNATGGGGVEGKIFHNFYEWGILYIGIFCNHITYVILLQLPWICWVYLVQPVHHEIECANLIRADSLLIDWGQSIREVMGWMVAGFFCTYFTLCKNFFQVYFFPSLPPSLF